MDAWIIKTTVDGRQQTNLHIPLLSELLQSLSDGQPTQSLIKWSGEQNLVLPFFVKFGRGSVMLPTTTGITGYVPNSKDINFQGADRDVVTTRGELLCVPESRSSMSSMALEDAKLTYSLFVRMFKEFHTHLLSLTADMKHCMDTILPRYGFAKLFGTYRPARFALALGAGLDILTKEDSKILQCYANTQVVTIYSILTNPYVADSNTGIHKMASILLDLPKCVVKFSQSTGYATLWFTLTSGVMKVRDGMAIRLPRLSDNREEQQSLMNEVLSYSQFLDSSSKASQIQIPQSSNSVSSGGSKQCQSPLGQREQVVSHSPSSSIKQKLTINGKKYLLDERLLSKIGAEVGSPLSADEVIDIATGDTSSTDYALILSVLGTTDVCK